MHVQRQPSAQAHTLTDTFGFQFSLGSSLSPGKYKDSDSASKPGRHAGAFDLCMQAPLHLNMHVHESSKGKRGSDLKSPV